MTNLLRPSLLLRQGVEAAEVAEAEADAAVVEDLEAVAEEEAEDHQLHRERHLLCELDHLAMLHPPFP